jgi:hypothetical protein
MFGKTSKRSSDDCVLVDTKKKKISKDKQEASNVKTAIVCNGDLRQKKAFFAFFGKSLDDKKIGSMDLQSNDSIMAKVVNKTTKVTNKVASINSKGYCSQSSLENNEIMNTSQFSNHCFIKYVMMPNLTMVVLVRF